MKIALVLIAIIAAAVLIWALRPASNLARAYDERRLALPRPAPSKVLTEADIAHLPTIVQTYLRRTGAIGKPIVTSVHVVSWMTLYRKPGDAGMSGEAHQIDRLDPERRLFFMRTRMSGLPVAVLHDRTLDEATMQVCLARLVNVVDTSGEALSKTETVTFLNDIATFAPSALVRPEFTWGASGKEFAEVIMTSGRFTVSARLEFDAGGDLVNFISDDRGEIQPDGTLKMMRWETPLGDYRDFDGRRVPTRGEAIWQREDGPFVYGRFELTDVRFNQPEDDQG